MDDWSISIAEVQALGTFLAVIAAVAGPFIMHWLEKKRRAEIERNEQRAAMILVGWDLLQLYIYVGQLMNMKDHPIERFCGTAEYLSNLNPEVNGSSESILAASRLEIIEKLSPEMSVAYANVMGLRGRIMKSLQAYLDFYKSGGEEELMDDQGRTLFASILENSRKCREEAYKILNQIEWIDELDDPKVAHLVSVSAD